MIYYLILAHKNLKQLELLVKKLKTENSEIYIHIDKKVREFKKIDNVHYIEDRQNISRGGTSMIKTEIIGFSKIFQNMKKGDHLVLISGQCYPIKNINYIEKYIQDLGNKSCISYSKANNKIISRLSGYYFYDSNFHIPKIIDELIFSFVGLFTQPITPHRVPAINIVLGSIISFILPKRRYLIKNYEIYKGDQWMVLSYEHIKWILEFLETKEGKKYLSSFSYTACSDEMFFQIMMLNNKKLKKEINNELLRHIEREKYTNSPNILTIKDLDKIKKSNKLFARKFDINVDREIIKRIDDSNY